MLWRLEHRGVWMSVGAERSSGAPDVAAIWDEFHAGLLAFIGRRVRSREIAEDILQLVMLRIHDHAGDVKRPEAIGAWVYEIARNAIADHYRSAATRRELAAGTISEEAPPLQPVPDSDVRSELAACCIAPLLRQLPPNDREALTLTEIDGLTQAEAAARAGLSLSGMKSRVQRARQKLGQVLTECCEIQFDRRRGVIEYERRNSSVDRPG